LYAQFGYSALIQITWDPGKAASNRQKHGIDFADAATVFDDDYFVSQEDLPARGERQFMRTGKDRITIRLDKDILAWFKGRVHEQGGGNYQTLINDALREYIQGHGPLEAILRRVIREELHPTGHSRVPEGASDHVI
jgi:uncharacterized protein (DUF4415 family)